MNDLTVNKNAPTDDGEGFLDLLARYQPASNAHLQNNETLQSLADLLKPENLLFVNDVIAPNGHDLPTANSVAAVLHNADFAPTNAAIYPLDEQQPFTLHAVKDEAFVIGTGKRFLAFDDLEAAVILADCLADNGRQSDFTIIVPFHARQFESVVKAHAKARHVEVFTLLDTARQYANTLKGENVTIYGASDFLPLLIRDLEGDIDALISDEQIHNTTISEWGEPEPLDDDPSQPTRYPIEAWQGVLRDAVEAIAYHAQVPHAMAGQCVLGALSTIGQRFVNAPIDHAHKPAALFLITEGESGSGKTFASSLSHHSIKQWDKAAYLSFIELLNEWQADLDALKGKERKEYLKDNPRPKNKAMLLQDSTIEAALDRFILNEMPNLSWTTDEAAQFFSGYSMKAETKGNALGSLTKLWSDGEAQRSRSQRGANPQYKTNAYDVRLTLDLQGQRVILEPALTDPLLLGQGFLARALLACPDSLQGKRVWNTPERMNQSPDDDPRLQAYWARCDILLDPPPSNINTDITGKEMRHNMPFANQQARQALADFQQRIENRQAKGGIYEYFKAFAGRMAENASRIATLMAFFDCQTSLSVAYLQRAFLLVEYSIAERLRYVDIGTGEKPDIKRMIEWLIAWCKKNNASSINRTHVFQYAPNGLRGKKIVEPLLEQLESTGHVRQETIKRRNLVHINPYLLK